MTADLVYPHIGMPKKAPKQLEAYWATSIQLVKHDDLAAYLKLYPRKGESSEVESWFREHRHFNQFSNRLEHERQNDTEYWREQFLPCDKFFRRTNALEGEFYIIEHKEHVGKNIDGFGIRFHVLWSYADRELLNQALHCENPVKWNKVQITAKRIEDCFLFGSFLWILTKDDEGATRDQLRLLMQDALDKDREKFERLKRKFSGEAGAPASYPRFPIPETVRMYVWRRDGGRCASCGSCERLEYDHIIPVSQGGSNTDRNIQLLCEKCNRAKSDRI